MKTYYQNGITISKAHNLALSSCVESPILTISRNSIKFPYAILSFTDGLTMPLYAPKICEAASSFANDYENYLNCYSDDDKFGFRDIDDIRLDSLGVLIDDSLEIDGGFMILNSEKQHLRFSEIALQRGFLRNLGKEYIVKSSLSEEIIYTLDNNFSITPSSVLLTNLWEYINDDLESSHDIKRDLFAFGKFDFRESDKPLNIFNAEFKSALIFEICEYFANNGFF